MRSEFIVLLPPITSLACCRQILGGTNSHVTLGTLSMVKIKIDMNGKLRPSP